MTAHEPYVTSATVRDAGDELHIECRFSDGQKFAAVIVAVEFEGLAHSICEFLNSALRPTDNERTERVEVTQADRIAAAPMAVLAEMRDLILAGKADHYAEPFARHRIAALRAQGQDERAVIVAFVRANFDAPHVAEVAKRIADAIEAGQHKEAGRG